MVATRSTLPLASPPPSRSSGAGGRLLQTAWRWVDSWAAAETISLDEPQRVDWLRIVPFILLHVACLTVVWVGWSFTAVGVAAALYAVRMFAVTAFYHRYFSHKTFETSRAGQFVLAVLGATCVQRGPLWWAAHHRNHHASSDTPADVHSPVVYGFWWSHVGWITSRPNFRTRLELVPDLARYPELRFLDRFDTLVPVLLALSLYGLGEGLATWAPGLGTSGWQLVVWGFVISTVVLLHAAVCVNSLSHLFGTQRFESGDQSRNSMLIALFTFGEGWHNNHHAYPGSTRQGFYWWEVDLTYYLLNALSWTGLIWNLRPVPDHVLERGRAGSVPRAAWDVTRAGAPGSRPPGP